MRVGLYGGSFNPPHEGHIHVARTAAGSLGLQRVVFLVSPQNPLKAEAASLEKRLAATRRLARDYRFSVSGLEADLGSAYTVDTVLWFKRRYPAVNLIWLIGSDNLLTFHRWRAWRRIIREIPIAVVARPGSVSRGRLTSGWAEMRRLGHARFLDAALNATSSTQLRKSGTGWRLP